MARSPSFAGVVLAAGASTRMGQDKALLQYGGRTCLAGAIQLLQNACDFVVVVAGSNVDQVASTVYANSGYLVRNPQPELGQFSSLRLGIQAVLDRGRDTACVTLVDRPPAEPKTLQTLKEHFLFTTPERTCRAHGRTRSRPAPTPLSQRPRSGCFASAGASAADLNSP